jgi:hypothetical protein
MWIDMRWLEKTTGKTLQDDSGYYYPETERVLQIRSRQDSASVWTDWEAVPVVKDSVVEKAHGIGEEK